MPCRAWSTPLHLLASFVLGVYIYQIEAAHIQHRDHEIAENGECRATGGVVDVGEEDVGSACKAGSQLLTMAIWLTHLCLMLLLLDPCFRERRRRAFGGGQ